MSATSISLIPPDTGGVYDYARALSQGLDAPLVQLTATTDIGSLSGDFLFLHFSGYGYQKRGVPFWLVKTIRELRSRFKGVGVIFHELFASGPIWGSAFWLSSWQQRIARELLLLSDFWLTNREASARWLLGHSHAAPHRVLPVFSNVGEPALGDGQRERILVVFGSSGIRAPVYEWSDGEIFRCAKRCGLEIHDIGGHFPEGRLSRRLAQEGVVAHGKLPAEQVSRAMSRASFGAVAYPADYVSKSGVFAAYCAHAMCPILLSEVQGAHDGLTADVHYAAGFGAIEQATLDPEKIGKAAHEWYEPHRVEAHVAALRALTAEVR